MDDLDPVLVFVQPLNQLRVRYMITGSVASIAYGQPRLTHDVDVVVELNPAQCAQLVEAFPLTAFYCPPLEVMRLEVARANRGHFNIIHHATGFKADVYPMGSDNLHAWGLARRREIRMGAALVPLAPPEYVILRKLEYYQEGGSEKHVLDIRSMLETSASLIDTNVLERLIVERRLGKTWEHVKP